MSKWNPKALSVMAMMPLLCLTSAPAIAQDTKAGRTAKVASGEVGQRQSREEAAPNIKPTRRISGRVQSRIENRISNRIDRDYEPTADAASSFENATKQASKAGRPPPR